MEAIHRVGSAIRKSRIVLEGPAVGLEARNCVSDRDQAVALLKRPIDQGAVRPRATVRDIEMVAARLGLESGRTVGRDAVAEPAVGAAELSEAAGLLREVLVTPNPLDQHAHEAAFHPPKHAGRVTKSLDIL
jgi:hypothetical protein